MVHYSNPRPGSRHFLLMCGAGVDASIVYHLDTRLKDYMGQGAYWVGSIEQLQRKFESFEIRMNGKTHLSTFAVISKSRRYAGKLTLTPNAHLLAEHFEVVVFHGIHRFDISATSRRSPRKHSIIFPTSLSILPSRSKS